MSITTRPRALLQLDVPKFGTHGSGSEFILLNPNVLELTWTRNNHLVADELTTVVDWKEAGIDPRFIKNARCGMWFWDENFEDFDREKHLRFEGVCKKAKRANGEGGATVDLTFHDYTTLFINMKPFPTTGMPEWTDTLQTAWWKLCDNTGWMDPDNKKIISSVAALRDRLVIRPEHFKDVTLGSAVHPRFLKIGKPSPPSRCDAWAVWNWVCTSLGLITVIRGTQCFVLDSNEYFTALNAPRGILAENIYDLEEEADCDTMKKGIQLTSYDPITRRVVEARYPPPGDERIKTKRSAVGKKSDEGANITANEVSGQYEEFEYHHVTDQATLDRCALSAYEQYSRQEMEGSFKTTLMRLPSVDDTVGEIDILGLNAGDAVRVEIDNGTLDILRNIGSATEQLGFLIHDRDYDPEVAELIVANLKVDQINTPIFHVKTVGIEYADEKFEVTVHYHNLVNL